MKVQFWFHNVLRFLDKTNRTGSQFQLINGILLVLTFFSVRIVYGGYIVGFSFSFFPPSAPISYVTDVTLGLSQSIYFFFTLLQVRHEIPLAYLLIYAFGNLMLQALSWFWWELLIFFPSSSSSFLMEDWCLGFTK